MSDKPNRTTDRRLSVTSTLNEAIKMFDAVPMSDDVVLSYGLASYTTRAALFHYALELGMKYMSHAYKNTHQLVKIYRGLSGSDRELLDKAFKDAVSFYGFKVARDEWKHMRDFDTYLAKTGDNNLFLDFRYWPLDGESGLFESRIRLPDPIINREMVRFISDVIRGDGKVGEGFFVSKLVDIEVQKSFHQKGYQDNGNLRRFNEDPEALEEDFQILRQWVVNEHDSLMLAIKDAYEHDFDVLNDWGNTVLRSVYTSLKKTEDYRIRLALDYVFSTFGAKTSDCEEISSAQVRQVGRREQVRTPSGKPLGVITERHDGLWTAEDALARGPQLAVGKHDAIGLLIEDGTERVSVELNDGTTRETRVRFPDHYPYRFYGEEILCEFWDANHRVVTGDEISVRVIREDKTLPNLRIRGIVKSVNNHEVTISKTR